MIHIRLLVIKDKNKFLWMATRVQFKLLRRIAVMRAAAGMVGNQPETEVPCTSQCKGRRRRRRRMHKLDGLGVCVRRLYGPLDLPSERRSASGIASD